MRSEYLSLNASAAVGKAASIMRAICPKTHICSKPSNISLAKVSDVTQLELYLEKAGEPVKEFDGVQVRKTVYWLDIQDGSGSPKAYIRGVHFSMDGRELGESDIFELRELE